MDRKSNQSTTGRITRTPPPPSPWPFHGARMVLKSGFLGHKKRVVGGSIEGL